MKPMDYCIYKTVNNETPRIIYTFTQTATKGHAKTEATKKLGSMWARIVKKPTRFKNAKRNRTEFSYEYQQTTRITATARYYIAQAPIQPK